MTITVRSKSVLLRHVAKYETESDGIHAMRTSRYIEEMGSRARKMLTNYGADSEGRSLLAQSYYQKEISPSFWNILMAAGHTSYAYMFIADTLPLTWLVAYPVLAFWGRLA
jgi:phosphate uptake regulator